MMSWAEVHRRLSAPPSASPNTQPLSNIAITDTAPTLRLGAEGPGKPLDVVNAQFGLLPHFARSRRDGAKWFNVRSETLDQTRPFCAELAGKAPLPHPGGRLLRIQRTKRELVATYGRSRGGRTWSWVSGAGGQPVSLRHARRGRSLIFIAAVPRKPSLLKS